MSTAALPSMPRVRDYRPEDEDQLVEVWNAALVSDPINVTTWRAKVLLDPNFDPAGCLVVEVEERVCGFLLSLTRKIPFYDEELAPEGAWITAFGVHPAGSNAAWGASCSRQPLSDCARRGGKRLRLVHISPVPLLLGSIP